MIQHSPLLLAGVAAAMATAGCVQGIIGFGFGLVAMGLLPLMLGVKGAVPVVATMAVAVNWTLFLRFRKHFSASDAAPLFLGTLVGVPIGVTVLRAWSSDLLMTCLGVLVLLYVAWSLSRRETPPPLGRGVGAILGLVAGTLGGAFSTAGPPAVVWVSSQSWPSQQLRATLVGLFAVGGSIQVPMLAYGGLVDLGTVATVTIAAPAAALGSVVGARLGDRVPQEAFRLVMLCGLGLLAFVFIFNGVRGG